MGAGLLPVLERHSDGRPALDSDVGEDLRHVQPGVSIILGNAPPQQPGTLYITTKRLIWLSDTNSKGYSVDFLSLTMHAISRDPEAYALPCIYTQIDTDEMDDDDDYEDEAAVDMLESQNREDIDLSKVHEMRLVPSDASVLNRLFRVLCDCALLNPDPEGEQESDGEWFLNEEEPDAVGYSNGLKDYDITDISELQIDDQQFEDADERGGKEEKHS